MLNLSEFYSLYKGKYSLIKDTLVNATTNKIYNKQNYFTNKIIIKVLFLLDARKLVCGH